MNEFIYIYIYIREWTDTLYIVLYCIVLYWMYVCISTLACFFLFFFLSLFFSNVPESTSQSVSQLVSQLRSKRKFLFFSILPFFLLVFVSFLRFRITITMIICNSKSNNDNDNNNEKGRERKWRRGGIGWNASASLFLHYLLFIHTYIHTYISVGRDIYIHSTHYYSYIYKEGER